MHGGPFRNDRCVNRLAPGAQLDVGGEHKRAAPRGTRTILAAIALGMSSLACAGSDADEIQKNVAAQRNFNAIQYVYQHGVPHTNGKVRR